jgi:hypothetical protein
MKPDVFSSNVNQEKATGSKPAAAPDLKQGETTFAPSPEAVARLANSIDKETGSQPGKEAKHWLESEAQLFGGLERESQIHPGSSLFVTEH